MSVTVTANKTVSFRSPYTGQTFQQLSEKILGRDGYLGGGATTDNGSTITVEPFSMVQFGIVADSLQSIVGLAVPAGPEPWFLIASLPDDDPDTGIIVSATNDLVVAATGVIVAYKTNGSWQNPRAVDVEGASQNAAEVGVEVGFALTQGVDGGGLLNQLDVATGDVVDPDATRRSVPPETGESAKIASVLPGAPHEAYLRNDVLVLRQLDYFTPELKVLRGACLSGPTVYTPEVTISATGTQTRPSFYGRPGGTINQQWWAWGDGNNLYIQGGPAGGAFAAAILLTSGAITGTWLAGQRASDSAVLLVYLDGIALKLVSFNPTTGAQIDAPVTIDTQANAIVRPRAVLDGAEKLHVVFEHDDGADQQIYYTKVETASASFGTAAVAPRIVAGAATSKNDTWPTIGVDRFGTAHISYITGTGTNEYGDLVYARINSAGTLVGGAVETYLVGSDAAYDDGTGFNNKIYLDFRKPSIAVTPHDEVYVALLGSPNGGTAVDDLLLFSPRLRARIGFDIIRLDSKGDSYSSCAVAVGDEGCVYIWTLFQITAGANHNGYLYTIDTLVAPGGRLSGTILRTSTLYSAVAMTPDYDSPLAIGSRGEVVLSLDKGASGVSRRNTGLLGGAGDGSRISRHPKDVELATYQINADASDTIPVSDGSKDAVFDTFYARPKKMNYPILVGSRGDYQGHDSLEAAIKTANELGGEVVLRSGRHLLRQPIAIHSGVTVRGDGMAYIDAASAKASGGGLVFSAGLGSAPAIASITGNKVTVSADIAGVKEGDFVELIGGGGTGFHRVSKVLARGASTVLLLDDEYGATAGTAPGGTQLWYYPAGIVIKNLSINVGEHVAASTDVIKIASSYQAKLQNLAFTGSNTGSESHAISFSVVNYMPLIEQIDLTRYWVGTPSEVLLRHGIDLGGEFGTKLFNPVVRHVRTRDGGATVMVRAICEYPELEFVQGDGTQPTWPVVRIEDAGGRTTPVYAINCQGRFEGVEDDLAFVHTAVGRRLVVPVINEGGADTAGLELEDGNTRASTITDKAIKLTSATQKEFNSLTKDVITAAVNERVRKQGDTMDGDLLMGADILTDGTADRVIGANSANNRFTVHALAITNAGSYTAGGNILTDGTPRDIGTGANRFNGSFNTGNINTLVVNTGVDSSLIPAGAYGLGDASNPWDVYADAIKHTTRTKYISPEQFFLNSSVIDGHATYLGASTAGLGYWGSSTTDPHNWEIPISSFLLQGDRIKTLYVQTDHVAAGGVQVTAKLWRLTNPSFGSPFTGATQISTTKTYTPAAGGKAHTGWSTVDTDFTPNGLTLGAFAYIMTVTIPDTPAGSYRIKVGHVVMTFDRP